MLKKCLPLVLVLLVMLPLCALADSVGTVYLSASPCEDGAELPADAVALYAAGSQSYFLMPGGSRWEEARVWFSGNAASIEIDGVSYQNGERLSGLQDGT